MLARPPIRDRATVNSLVPAARFGVEYSIRLRKAAKPTEADLPELMPKRAVAEEANPKPKSTTTPAQPPLGRMIWLWVAAWAVPGLGHWMLKRKWRALILFVCIVAMFLLGLAMKGQFFSTDTGSYLEALGYFGEMCVGLAMPAAKFFGYSGGDPFFASADYGTAFLVAAGMLNVLSILDVHDIALGRKP